MIEDRRSSFARSLRGTLAKEYNHDPILLKDERPGFPWFDRQGLLVDFVALFPGREDQEALMQGIVGELFRTRVTLNANEYRAARAIFGLVEREQPTELQIYTELFPKELEKGTRLDILKKRVYGQYISTIQGKMITVFEYFSTFEDPAVLPFPQNQIEELAGAGATHALFEQLGKRLLGRTVGDFMLSSNDSGELLNLEHMGDEQQIVVRAKRYEEDAFGEIYDRNYQRIFTYIYYRVDDTLLAEDLAAETFVRALQSIHAFRFKGVPFSAWLYRIAGNLVIDHFRRMRPTFSLDSEAGAMIQDRSQDTQSNFFQTMEIEELRIALKYLTEEQQQVVILRFVDGLTSGEVADIMGKTEGAIKALQHRAIVALGRILGKDIS